MRHRKREREKDACAIRIKNQEKCVGDFLEEEKRREKGRYPLVTKIVIVLLTP